MVRHSKPPKPIPLCVAELRLIVAKNLDALISERFRQLPTPQERFRALAERTGVGEETIRRFIREARSDNVPDLTLDKIALFADALQVRPSDLVTPFLAAQQLPAAARAAGSFVHEVPGTPPRRPGS